MVTPTLNTVIKMLEPLPESLQKQAADRLCEYIAEIQEEQKWDKAFAKTQGKLSVAARQARREIAAGKAAPLDFDRR